MTRAALPTIDAWRHANWWGPGSCDDCGDPIILADTEDWERPLCVGCWDNRGRPSVEPTAWRLSEGKR